MLRVARYTLAAVSITLTLVGCQDATAPDDAALRTTPMMSHASGELAPLDSHVVRADLTDPAITFGAGLANAEHYVWRDTSAQGNAKLLVFMPGARGRPFGWKLVQKEAARLGYHVIGLMYQND